MERICHSALLLLFCRLGLLTRAILDRLFDLLLHCFEVEGSRGLHRRIFDCRLGQLPDILLNQDETPELTGEEVVAIAECAQAEIVWLRTTLT